MGKMKSSETTEGRRAPAPPEQTSLNVRRQAPTYPGADGEEALEDLNRNEEPGNVPDEAETGPVFDRAEGPPPTFYSGEGDPEAKPDDANEVEVRHSGRKKG
jgi:hypothetical protein